MTNVSTDDTRRPPVLYIGPGSLINTEVLIDELRMISSTCQNWKIPLPSIFIDESAIIINENHVASEQALGMRGSIGSTTEGIGAARADQIMRNNDLEFAGNWFPAWFEIRTGTIRGRDWRLAQVDDLVTLPMDQACAQGRQCIREAGRCHSPIR